MIFRLGSAGCSVTREQSVGDGSFMLPLPEQLGLPLGSTAYSLYDRSLSLNTTFYISKVGNLNRAVFLLSIILSVTVIPKFLSTLKLDLFRI